MENEQKITNLEKRVTDLENKQRITVSVIVQIVVALIAFISLGLSIYNFYRQGKDNEFSNLITVATNKFDYASCYEDYEFSFEMFQKAQQLRPSDDTGYKLFRKGADTLGDDDLKNFLMECAKKLEPNIKIK